MESVRVVVVDDSEAVRVLVARVLERHGYAAVPVESAEDAVRAFAAGPTGCCVVDYHLPGMSGAELVRLLRRWPDAGRRDVPIVGLSGRAGSEHELLRAGANHFVPKPFREADLVDAVRRVLGGAPGPVP